MLLLGLLAAAPACNKEDAVERGGEEAAAPAAQAPATGQSAVATPAEPPQPAANEEAAEPAGPEPTTPEEIDTALKAAMVEGRDQDVLKYCEMAGIKPGEGDGQTQLGCTLAACRTEQADKAKAWSKGLPKPLMKQAAKICLASKVVL